MPRITPTKRDVFYEAGDAFATTGAMVVAGLATSSATHMRFNIPVDKSMDLVRSIAVERLSGAVRGTNGYVAGSDDGTNWLTSGFSVSAGKISSRNVRVYITSPSAFSNMANNTPVVGFFHVTFRFS